jgi:hypothetical protein
MRVRELSDRELTLAFLDRQLLLERRPMAAARAVHRLVALQAQYSLSPYVALHSRLDRFRVNDLESALRRGTVVKATLMRGTLHLVAASDLPTFASAWGRRAAAIARGRSPRAAATEADLVAGLRAALVEPRSTDEIRGLVRELTGSTVAEEHLLDHARLLVPLVHAWPSGGWRQHGKFSLVLAPGPAVAEPAATARLVERYLAAYGPATREDIVTFTGLTRRQVDPAIVALGPARRFTDGRGRDLFDVARGRLVAEDLMPPSRLLAKWDAALLSHRDRARIVPPELDPLVFGSSANGEIGPCYLVDGLVAGRWRHDGDDSSAVLTFEPLVPGATLPSDLEDEALRMLDLLAPDARRRRVEVSS